MDEEDEDIDFSEELEEGLVPAIKRWYSDNELRIVIVEGYQGVGKSLYALLTASEIYKTWNWEILRKSFAYDPEELLRTIRRKRERSPLLIWDDAGNWLNNQDYKNRWVKETAKYFQVARTDFSCIMLTTVDAEDIVKSIRTMNNRILVQILRNSSKKEPDRRKARIYTRWKSPDKKRQGEENKIEEEFYFHHCDWNCYKQYEAYRKSFAKKATNKMLKYMDQAGK